MVNQSMKLIKCTKVNKVMVSPNRKYEIVVKHRPSIPDNIKHSQVFNNDQNIKMFLELTYEFASIGIDG